MDGPDGDLWPLSACGTDICTYSHITNTQMRACSEELSTLIACMSCFCPFFLVVVVVCMSQGCMHVEVRGVALLLPPFYGICGSVSSARLGLHSKHVCPPSHLSSPCSPQCCVEMLSLMWQNSRRTQPSKLGSSLFENQWFKHMKLMELLEAQSPGCLWKPCCLHQCFAKCRSVSSVLAWCHPFTGHNPMR